MEYFYTAYTKQVLDQNYFFVKRYMKFPELKNAADILDGYGMHHDFHSACRIAGITNQQIKEQLWLEVEPQTTTEARVVPMIFHHPQQNVSRWQWANLHWRGLTLAKLRVKF